MKKSQEKRMKMPKDWQLYLTKLQDISISCIKRSKIYSRYVLNKNTKTREAQKLKFYQNIDEMPMSCFMDVLCDRNFQSLYKGKPPIRKDHDFEKEWFDYLYLEYTARMFEKDASVYEHLKRMALNLSKIRIIEAAILLLYSDNIDDVSKGILAAFSVRLTGQKEKDLLILTSLREYVIRKYNQAKEKYDNQMENENTQSRSYFIGLLTNMSGYYKYNLSYLTITVGEFCSYYNQMKEEIKKLKQQEDVRKHR